jgi:ABC-type sugar transport system substrate-binding protein
MRSKSTIFLALLIVASVFVAIGPSSVANSQAKANALRPHSLAKTLGIIEVAASDLAAVEVTRSAEAAAKKAGWTVLVTDAESEPSRAVAAMEDYVARGVTGILSEIFVSSELTTGLNAARKAHIPVVSWGGGLAPGVGAAYDENGGDIVGRALLKAMGGKDTGSILDFTYHPGLPCLERENSFSTVMKSYPNIKITRHEINLVNVAVDGESTAAAWLLTSPKPPIGIFGCYDDPSVATIAALKELGYKPGQVKVVGVNAGAPALAEIKSGWMFASLFFASAATGPVLFSTIGKIIAAGSSWHQIESQIPSILVTRGNLASFEAKYGDV